MRLSFLLEWNTKEECNGRKRDMNSSTGLVARSYSVSSWLGLVWWLWLLFVFPVPWLSLLLSKESIDFSTETKWKEERKKEKFQVSCFTILHIISGSLSPVGWMTVCAWFSLVSSYTHFITFYVLYSLVFLSWWHCCNGGIFFYILVWFH